MKITLEEQCEFLADEIDKFKKVNRLHTNEEYDVFYMMQAIYETLNKLTYSPVVPKSIRKIFQ